MTRLTRRLVVGALAATTVVAAVVVVRQPGAEPAAASREDAAGPAFARVERGRLSASVSQDGMLTYRAQAGGAPFALVSQASGTFTKLPPAGTRIACGGVALRIDDRPVVLLCGTIPAYRDLRLGMAGRDVRQLNRNLHALGYDRAAGTRVAPRDRHFTTHTERALRALQRRKGVGATGVLTRAGAVVMPGPIRVAKVSAVVGGAARPGAPVLQATSDALHVQVNLDPSQQGDVARGDRAQVTLPGNRVARGRVSGFGRIAEGPDEPGRTAEATIPTYVTLDDPRAAGDLDRSPVHVDITTDGLRDALSVPVTAVVGRTGGGFAVEVVRPGGARALVAVRLGLFDAGGGRVQVEGAVRAGDAVVVPAS